MTRKGAVLAALTTFTAIISQGTAMAAPAAQCAEHKDMIQVLAKKYSEAPKAVGLVNNDRVVEIFVSEKGTWTILVTKAGGTACILAAGQEWEEVPLNFQSLDPAA